VASEEPLYAIRSDPGTATLVVGPRRSLGSRHVKVHGALHVPVAWAHAKLRYRSEPVPAKVEATGDGFDLTLERPAFAVAPGQVAALYDYTGVVVGAGIVRDTSG
jgi:tRNA-uridine 2-sulfurtransferase